MPSWLPQSSPQKSCLPSRSSWSPSTTSWSQRYDVRKIDVMSAWWLYDVCMIAITIISADNISNINAITANLIATMTAMMVSKDNLHNDHAWRPCPPPPKHLLWLWPIQNFLLTVFTMFSYLHCFLILFGIFSIH